MKTRLLYIWDAARTSYWFVPGLIAVGALALSILLPWLDELVRESGRQLPEWILTTVDAARATLSAMAGAMVTVTGTVFSITIVTLSLTSQQFGPRLLRRFMYDLTTQVTLGIFLSTGFYCLLLLRAVENNDDATVAPHLSVFAATLFAVLSLVMLIVFIHHVAMLIQAPNVVAAVAEDLNDAIDRMFPERLGQPADAEEVEEERSARDQESRLQGDSESIPATEEGYIQAVAADSLIPWAQENQLVVKLRYRPGDFITNDSPVAAIWTTQNGSNEKLCRQELIEQLNESIIVGSRRTPRQDIECAISELVEVAVRALSPGVNDPFTAINCIDRLGAALGRLAERRTPSPYRCDDQGQLRVIARPHNFTDVIGAAFNQIRQYGRDSVAVTIRLLEALRSIARHVQSEEDRAAVKLHADMIAHSGKSFSEQTDQEEVQDRLQQIMQELGKAARSGSAVDAMDAGRSS